MLCHPYSYFRPNSLMIVPFTLFNILFNSSHKFLIVVGHGSPATSLYTANIVQFALSVYVSPLSIHHDRNPTGSTNVARSLETALLIRFVSAGFLSYPSLFFPLQLFTDLYLAILAQNPNDQNSTPAYSQSRTAAARIRATKWTTFADARDILSFIVILSTHLSRCIQRSC